MKFFDILNRLYIRDADKYVLITIKINFREEWHMTGNGILESAKGLTRIENRPNIIVTDIRTGMPAEDDLANLLVREEINVCRAQDGVRKLKERCPAGSWHMIIIRDGGLADPAFDVIENIRRFSDIPLLTVSDDCSEIYRIMALCKGADACMSADGGFGAFEFKARVVSMLRRQLRSSGEDIRRSITGADMLQNGDLTVDRRRREIYSKGVKIRMTAIEYGIVEYLMENCGDVCTVEDIYRRVWQENPYSVKKTVVEHIRRIRSKIEPDPHNPCYIKVVFGIGYKMERAV